MTHLKDETRKLQELKWRMICDT